MLLTELYKDTPLLAHLLDTIISSENSTPSSTPFVKNVPADKSISRPASSNLRLYLKGVTGSLDAVLCATSATLLNQRNHLVIASSKEDAYYLQNDLETLLEDTANEVEKKRVFLFPTTYRKLHHMEDGVDNANIMMRSEVVKQLNSGRCLVVVTYPEALLERVISSRTLTQKTLQVAKGAKVDMDFIINVLHGYDFEHVDFVVEPGQYAVRGGIIDVFSFANDNPYRIEFFDDQVDSLRTFDTVSQLSIKQYDKIAIIPNLQQHHDVQQTVEEKVNLLHYYNSSDMVWAEGLPFVVNTIDRLYNEARQEHNNTLENSTIKPVKLDDVYSSADDFLHELLRCRIVEMGSTPYFSAKGKNDTRARNTLEANSERQPMFNKQFDLLIDSLTTYLGQGYRCLISVTNQQQRKRLEKIFAEFPTQEGEGLPRRNEIGWLPVSLRSGYIDHQNHVLVYTDHEIFERYHKYTIHNLEQNREALTVKDLMELKPGDYVTHIDYGIGRFAGLEKIENNGKTQEVIRLVYKNNEVLYMSIHGLNKISRYVGKEGTAPTLNRLGSGTWQALKNKTKKHVKDIAKDLIKLYAQRKASRGFAFNNDTYLQNELEASFIYEDTPDQLKATQDVKQDMEDRAPMDRLVCGDVGFGKTEVAIRAAFKAVCDNKQVAVLVPSTILAFQHYNTFTERLKDLPVNIDYLNRFRTTKEKNKILTDLRNGKIDIIIGTHAITGKSVQFKDLGLLIVDEEQKFGVSVKEKLRQIKVNVDCLTLTATPIPRTLQFSLMGARDLSVMQTPPPNRQPIETELCDFSEEVIRDAINFELNRGGQTFFVSNRVENLPDMAGLVQRLVPDAKVAVTHGQMDGKVVETTLMKFLDGEVDVLVVTAIIENGLDIPNANTMIINNAQQFGLADLHQMRGRVGRSNKKAFCYMMVPSFQTLTADAQKRLRAISEFSTIGSGFNIAMRDLDIRGAGNILGAEQSGFISDIGYETYHKILNEAIDELKATDFRDLFELEIEKSHEYVKECTIDTDLSVLLPDSYVSNVTERLVLYKELNGLVTEEELDAFRQRLIDRFGPVPHETEELVKTITLRRIAKDFGIEKLVLKGGKMRCDLVRDPDNPFYSSQNFQQMIRYLGQNTKQVKLRQDGNNLSLICDEIDSIAKALNAIREVIGETPYQPPVTEFKTSYLKDNSSDGTIPSYQHQRGGEVHQAHQKGKAAQRAMQEAENSSSQNAHRGLSFHNLKKIGEHRI